MNKWMDLSLAYATQRSYLDDLFSVYPTIPEGIREIDKNQWNLVEKSFFKKNNVELINSLFSLPLFPLKDSYVAYLKRDKSSIDRNPRTVNRLCGRLYELGLDEIYKRCAEPKETNRQIGPMFKRWIKDKKPLGIEPVLINKFLRSKEDAVLDASDAEMVKFAMEYLNYQREKGLDFIGRFNGKYIIAEAKFLTDFGGHQNSQFNDAMDTLQQKNVNAIIIAVLDGVLYIKGKNKLYRDITTKYSEFNIMSSLVLREFLYQV